MRVGWKKEGKWSKGRFAELEMEGSSSSSSSSSSKVVRLQERANAREQISAPNPLGGFNVFPKIWVSK